MSNIKANKRTLIRWKVYFDRAKMYIGYLQFLMIGFVLLEAYKETPFGVWVFNNLLLSIPTILIVFIAASLVVGRLDTVSGLREEELRNSSSSNPVMREILLNIREIRAELEEKKT
jgi:hypothetical protein